MHIDISWNASGPASPPRRAIRRDDRRAPVLLHGEPAELAADDDARVGLRPSLLTDLLAAGGAGERQRIVKAVLHAMGFEWLGYGRLVERGERAVPLSFCTTYADPRWTQHYFGEAYHEIDPRLQDALRSSLPCVWTLDQLAHDADRAPAAPRLRRFVEDLRDTGVRCGALLVLPGAAGQERHFVSLLSRAPLGAFAGNGLLGQVLTFALCLHEFYSRHTQEPRIDDASAGHGDGGPQLTPLQREILACVARGLGDKQIAYGLALSSHAVDYHMRQLRRRFAVRNRVQLTQAALRAGTC